MWDHSKFGHSSQFLAGPIHSEVEKQYYEKNIKNLKEYAVFEKNAQKLSKYLNDLKNYQKNLENNQNNIFSASEYQILINVFSSIRNKQGLSSTQIFRHQESGKAHYFQQELADLQIALKSIVEEESFDENKIKELKGQIIIGQDRTQINFPAEQIFKETTQQLLKKLQEKTIKKIKKEKSEKKSINSSLIRFNSKEPKIDLRTNSVQINQNIQLQYANIADFAKLYSNSSISAKNYNEMIYQDLKGFRGEQGFHIGNTQLFRIIADFIPTLSVGLDRQAEISFQYAIFKRYLGLVKTSIAADNEIESHFMHIQNIYELMGVGQNYYKNNTLNELNDILKQGVDYLIVNLSYNDYIQVFSTRKLLYDMYQNMLSQNRTLSFFNSFKPV